MKDKEAYEAIWRAICDGADRLSGRCQVFIVDSTESKIRVGVGLRAPSVEIWQLVEALSLIMILAKADSVHSKIVANLFGRNGPLHIVEDNQDRFVWTQHTVRGQGSELGSRPDIMITDSKEEPSSQTILRIIECKCRKCLGTHEVRAEYGKAVDLKVMSYLLWSYSTPTQRVVNGAKRLGIDLVPLGFDTSWRTALISKPEILQAHIYNSLDVSRQKQNFARKLTKTAEDLNRKNPLLKS